MVTRVSPRPERALESGRPSPVRRMSLWPPPRTRRHNSGRRRLRLLVGGAAALALAAVAGVVWALLSDDNAPSAAEGIPEEYAGRWSGEMAQHDDSGALIVEWGVTLKLDEWTDRGSADLFTLDCRGSVVLTESTDDSLVFDYTETYDPEDRCIDHNVLTLTRQGPDALEAEWTATSRQGTPMTSVGTLK